MPLNTYWFKEEIKETFKKYIEIWDVSKAVWGSNFIAITAYIRIKNIN